MSGNFGFTPGDDQPDPGGNPFGGMDQFGAMLEQLGRMMRSAGTPSAGKAEAPCAGTTDSRARSRAASSERRKLVITRNVSVEPRRALSGLPELVIKP